MSSLDVSVDLLIPALAGYLFLRWWRFTAHKIARESGHHVAFQSALVGLLFYVVGWLIPSDLLGSGLLDQALTRAEQQIGISRAGLWALVLSGGALVVANLSVARWPHLEARWNEAAARDKEDSVVALLYEALARARVIEVSLTGNKTYVGWVVKTPGTEHDRTFHLVPLFSGYRNERQELVLSASYAGLVTNRVEEGQDLADLRVVIPRSSVRWARFFEVSLYSVPEGEQPPKEVG